ncbi:MAG: thymidine phosphorylase [Acholeplasmataceae bacterium]
MNVIDIINKKKYGHELTNDEISFVIKGYTKGLIPDYQISALLMAIYFKGMTDLEATYLTLAMRDSGDVLNLDEIKGIKVDKHSTGGVGDKVSLILAPLVATLGAKLAKMSGRGLGHTGGTLDKLESIKDFKIEITFDEFKDQVNKIGCSIIGQSGDIAPADKLLYALRDVTGTVDSIPLIAASIMSKKLASGSDAIVLDVKFGNGAFMKTKEEAIKLAKLMVEIGKNAGKHMTAILTSMEEPLGHKIGNSLEVYEAIETLEGNGSDDLNEVVSVITGHLLLDAKIVKDFKEGYNLALTTLKNKSALPKFYEFIKAQHGDLNFIKDKNNLLKNSKMLKVASKKTGYIESMDALEIGLAAMKLGAGRATKDDEIDLFVGIDLHKKIGDKVLEGETLYTLYHNNKGLEEAEEITTSAIQIGQRKKSLKLIEETIN